MNVDVEIITDILEFARASGVNRLFVDNTLLKTLTDSEPRCSGLNGFRDGLRVQLTGFKSENLKHYRPMPCRLSL